MTPEQIELARHALGLDGLRRISFRNHFVTGPGSDDYDHWMAMVKAGHATRRPGSQLTGGDDLFRLTRSGAELALQGKEKLDQEDFPVTEATSAAKPV